MTCGYHRETAVVFFLLYPLMSKVQDKPSTRSFYRSSAESICFSNPYEISIARLRRLSVRPHFQTTSPLKPLGRLGSNFICSILLQGECFSYENRLFSLVAMATVCFY